MEQNYLQSLQSLNPPSFQAIRNLARQTLAQYSNAERDKFYHQLDRGKALLQTHNQLCQYLYSFGNMHEAKLEDSIARVPNSFWNQDFEIVDWGCGQGIGTLKVFDLLRSKGQLDRVKRVSLIEPGAMALQRAVAHVAAAKPDDCEVQPFNLFFEKLETRGIKSSEDRPRLHLFSNILDVEAIDLRHLAKLLDSSVLKEDCIVSVGPIYSSSHRIEAFLDYFDPIKVSLQYAFEQAGFKGKNWTYKALVWSLNATYPEHLKDIENYPAVHFRAAYATDLLFSSEGKEALQKVGLQNFAVTAPYDLGGYVYRDLDPFLTVLHNIIVRGTPTKASPFLDRILAEKLGLSKEDIISGAIEYKWVNRKQKVKLNKLIEALNQDPKRGFKDEGLANRFIQFVYSPIAIARFHKVLLEALLTKKLNLKQQHWKILVEEQDVPFAALALEDFKQLYYHLNALLGELGHYSLPSIDLFILSNERFKDSPLHLDNTVLTSDEALKNNKYDLVVTQSVFKLEAKDMDRFSDYRVNNQAYYHIRSTAEQDVPRYLYTTDLIEYAALGEKDDQGYFQEKEQIVKSLEYFLQIFFRKQAFRPGQLPILDRALRRLPVIGLLPTGGGKSLTYQIAALLQPGLTMVVDPLKSLMKDQFEGLLKAGIDAATFINSSLTAQEKRENELMLESSQALFTFLSPERLGIANFRERLEAMYDRDAYFSYGVIDEVHCVSEWGHDFRFNYLHLGRNLYHHVKARNGIISLFGLTATASFDVLADVERELSANGAFELDADTIVRFENTNRLELQYRVERVAIDFNEKLKFDKKGILAPHLPKAIDADNPFGAFDSKMTYLGEYLFKLPEKLKVLLSNTAIDTIVKRFFERQNMEYEDVHNRLRVEVDDNFWTPNKVYDQAAIVFCPHVKNTGVSVQKNSEFLKEKGVLDIASYSGQDDDAAADANLVKFRENESPLMVATKAFGMGIDKPNVRYTINLNYSSSLEAFVQEAGRAGRDQKMALSTILFSDYRIAQIRRDYPVKKEPIGLLYDHWFKESDLIEVLDYYGFTGYEAYLVKADPTKDVVKLSCQVNPTMFDSGACNNKCSEFNRCQLKKANSESRGWMQEQDLQEKLQSQGLSIAKKDIKYLSPDYGSNMYFYSGSFKGDYVEKSYMYRLQSIVPVYFENQTEPQKGFLDYLISLPEDTEIKASIKYVPDEKVPKEKKHDTSVDRQSDLSKAIYRLTCIGLIDDFTQDYSKNQFIIGLKRKREGQYYQALEDFLKRYFTAERAARQIEIAQQIEINSVEAGTIKHEIYQCLNFLIQFIYEKISEKRKRAIDDMRSFCLIGLENSDWIEANEELKDYIYYYFNSKYARRDHIAPNGEPFSLASDTEEGKYSDVSIVLKYLRIIDDSDPAVGSETPLDNVKHLHGAIKLIARSLTDKNPSISLLEAFCLAYLDPKENQNLINQLEASYLDGMVEFYERLDGNKEFWGLFERFNEIIRSVWSSPRLLELINSIELMVHVNKFKRIKSKYLSINE